MNDLEMMYQDLILANASKPTGKIDGNLGTSCGNGICAISEQYNPTCGDEIALKVLLAPASLKVNEAAPAKVTGVEWSGQGCSISQASASIMVQLIEGKTVEDAMKFYDAFHMLMNSRGEGVDEQVEDMLENAIVFSGTSKFPARIKCALLGWEAMKDSIVKSGAFVTTTHEH